MMRVLCLFREDFLAVHDVSALDVGQAYFELHHQLHRLVDQTMSAAGLSLARAKVLMRLSERGPMNQATLAGLLGFAPRSVTDIVDGSSATEWSSAPRTSTTGGLASLR